MTEVSLRRVFMARGFAGEQVELSGLKRCWSCAYADLCGVDPFAALRNMELSLGEGEVLAGWLGYECAMTLEPGLELPTPLFEGPAAWFGVFSEVQPAEELAHPSRIPFPDTVDRGEAPATYAARVENIRERITRGDLFQVNYSHRQSASFPPSPKRLIEQLPWTDALSADYGALFDMETFSVLSASPELFLSLRDGLLAAEPVKGTRPRQADAVRDEEVLRDLINDLKDRAENIMITDLLRNDLSKVAIDGSMREPVICAARSHDHVHHLYSRVEARLRDGLVFADALAAAFPCGSITGAPKRAAMEAIAELEGEGRGPYCGAILFIPRAGQATASVAIRTAVIDETTRTIEARSGGGVTILSDPQAEYREAIDKGYLFRHLAGQDDPDRR